MTKCPNCKKIIYTKELNKNLKVCLHCDYHYPMTAWERIQSFIDEDTFRGTKCRNGIRQSTKFPGIREKLEKDQKKTGLNEAIVTGIGNVNGIKVVIAVMDSHFRMASMGSVVGEKITRAIEKADELTRSIYYFYSFRWSQNARRCFKFNANGKNECCIEKIQ